MRAVLLFLSLVACAPAPEGRGIVSLLPAWTEVIVALDGADELLACTEYGEPGRDIPRIDWQSPRSAETIVRLGPAVVLKQKRRAAHDPLSAALRASGIRVVELPSESIADLRAAFVTIGDVMGRGEEGRALQTKFDREMAAVRVERKKRPRVLFVYTRSAGVIAHIGAAGPGSFLDEILAIAGARNALEDADKPYVQLDLERLVRCNPDIIIDNLPAEDDPAALWASGPLPKVRVRFVNDNRMLVPGPKLPDAVRKLAELIHGDS
jgi:iron complex transport system substrate-binding protein